MLFKDAQIDGIREGTTTRTYRRWRQPRVRVGRVYALRPGVAVRVIDVRPWTRPLTAADARAAGFDATTELVAALRPKAGTTLYRVDFERCDAPIDPRAALAVRPPSNEEAEGIARKLAAMDRRADAPWTHRVLGLIAAHPGRRAADLAAQLNLPTTEFKTRVRRLKALGLTESLEIGYRLSARGRSIVG